MLSVALTGCGGDDDDDVADAAGGDIDAAAGMPDATPEPDAPTPDAGPLMTDQCPATYGPTGVSMTFEVAEGNVGFDLDEDGDIDNILGGSGIRSVLNSSFQSNLNNGSLRSLAELRDFGGLGVDDNEVTLVLYGGTDPEDPADLTDDFDGDAAYYFSHAWVNSVTCEPRAAAQVTYDGDSGLLATKDQFLRFYVASFGGFLEIADAELTSTIEADLAGYRNTADMPAMLGGAITVCSLQKGDSMGFGDNALEAVADLFGLQPDIDVDGDGIEMIDVEGVGISGCVDGDGTYIRGSDCGCDPRMKDGYSIAFVTDIVGATILGPDPN